MEVTNKIYTFPEFIISYVSLSVIAGLFSFKVVNSLLDNIILPILDITILPDKKFIKFSSFYNCNKKKIKPLFNNNDVQYAIRYGMFIKDLIIWLFVMIILFMLYKISLNL
jgi:large-conductance mechanosensitive channel